MKVSKGFSLVEVLVAVAITGILSYIVMQISDTNNQMRRFAQLAQDESELSMLVSLHLDNPKYCGISIAGLYPSDPEEDPVNFKKEEIDFDGTEILKETPFDEKSEGLNVSFWLSNADGTKRTHKRLNGADNAHSQEENKNKVGFLKIRTIKLVFNNGKGACSENYCQGNSVDTAQLVVLYDKPITKSQTQTRKLIYNVDVQLKTNSTGISTIMGCSRGRQLANNFSNEQMCLKGIYDPSNAASTSVNECPDISGYQKEVITLGDAPNGKHAFSCCYLSPNDPVRPREILLSLQSNTNNYSGCETNFPTKYHAVHSSAIMSILGIQTNTHSCSFLPINTSLSPRLFCNTDGLEGMRLVQKWKDIKH